MCCRRSGRNNKQTFCPLFSSGIPNLLNNWHFLKQSLTIKVPFYDFIQRAFVVNSKIMKPRVSSSGNWTGWYDRQDSKYSVVATQTLRAAPTQTFERMCAHVCSSLQHNSGFSCGPLEKKIAHPWSKPIVLDNNLQVTGRPWSNRQPCKTAPLN